jgi:hypothetical protein
MELAVKKINILYLLTEINAHKFYMQSTNKFDLLENRYYGRRGSTALTMRQPSTRKSWHLLRRQAAVARSV